MHVDSVEYLFQWQKGSFCLHITHFEDFNTGITLTRFGGLSYNNITYA